MRYNNHPFPLLQIKNNINSHFSKSKYENNYFFFFLSTGGSFLLATGNPNMEIINEMANTCKTIIKNGTKLVVVVGGGVPARVKKKNFFFFFFTK